jgi:cytochrome b561
MSEYDHEPVRGLPGALPEDEHIIWQGAPDWKRMAPSALHIRLSVLYFGLIVIWAVSRSDWNTAISVALLGAVVAAMFTLFAWGVSRTTVYTLTNKRVVLRIGVALNKCINLPLAEIESANLKMLADGHGNIVLALKGMPRLGYVMLWPHARSLRFVRPQPMLRAIAEASNVAAMLFRATQNVQAIAPLEARQESSRNIPLVGAPA